MFSQHHWDVRYILDFQRTNINKHPQTEVDHSQWIKPNKPHLEECLQLLQQHVDHVLHHILLLFGTACDTSGARRGQTRDARLRVHAAWEVQAALEPHTWGNTKSVFAAFVHSLES